MAMIVVSQLSSLSFLENHWKDHYKWLIVTVIYGYNLWLVVVNMVIRLMPG